MTTKPIIEAYRLSGKENLMKTEAHKINICLKRNPLGIS